MRLWNRIIAGFAALCLAVSFAVLAGIPAVADGEEPEALNSMEALRKRIESDQSDGGALTLTGDIVIEAGQEYALISDKPVQIMTGGCRLVVAGTLTLGGGLSIVADGNSPAFTVSDGGVLRFDLSNGDVALSKNDGGVLVLVEEGGSVECTGLGGRLRLSATGSGSTVIDSKAPLDLTNTIIEAGESSTGILCTASVRLTASSVASGGITINAPVVELDTPYPYLRQTAFSDEAYTLSFLNGSELVKIWRTYDEGVNWALYPEEQIVRQDGILSIIVSTEDVETSFALCFEIGGCFSDLFRVGRLNGVLQADWDNTGLDEDRLPGGGATGELPETPQEDDPPVEDPPEEMPLPTVPVQVMPNGPVSTPTRYAALLPDADPDPKPVGSIVDGEHSLMHQTPDQTNRQAESPVTGTTGTGSNNLVIHEQQVPMAEILEDNGTSAVDPYTTTVSGERIAVLIKENPDSVSFRKHEVQVWVPTAALMDLKLEPADLFSIRAHVEDNLLSLEIAVNGQPVDIQGIQVGIPWDGRELSVSTKSGESVPFRYSSTEELLIITLPGTGAYLFTIYPPIVTVPTAVAMPVGSVGGAASGNGSTVTAVSFMGAGLLGILWRILGRRIIRILVSMPK